MPRRPSAATAATPHPLISNQRLQHLYVTLLRTRLLRQRNRLKESAASLVAREALVTGTVTHLEDGDAVMPVSGDRLAALARGHSLRRVLAGAALPGVLASAPRPRPASPSPPATPWPGRAPHMIPRLQRPGPHFARRSAPLAGLCRATQAGNRLCASKAPPTPTSAARAIPSRSASTAYRSTATMSSPSIASRRKPSIAPAAAWPYPDRLQALAAGWRSRSRTPARAGARAPRTVRRAS